MELQGYGTRATLTAGVLTISGTNPLGKAALGASVREVPLAAIVAVAFKDATPLVNGRITIQSDVGVSAIHFLNKATTDARALFEALVDESAANPASVPTGPAASQKEYAAQRARSKVELHEAYKAGISQANAESRQANAEFKAGMGQAKAGFSQANAEMKAGMRQAKAGFSQANAEFKAGMSQANAEIKAGKRRLPVWAWIVIGIVALGIGLRLSPIFTVIFLVILITGIVALVRNTPTWLRFPNRKAATWVTAAAAVAFLITGSLANVALSGSADDDPVAVAQVSPTAEASPSAKPTVSSTPKPSPTPTPTAVTVLSIIDGDTIETSAGKVRLIGMDTPEQGSWGYAEASAELGAFLSAGAVTLVAVDGRDDSDQYGRLLRYVRVNGRDAGSHMIATGWAIARYDGRDGYGTHPLQADYVTADAQHEMPAEPAPEPAPVQPAPAPAPARPAPVEVYYKNCDAVRAAGAAPIYQGQPGYASHLDRDKDGIGCDN